MKLTDDRTALDTALAAAEMSICVLRGPLGSDADKVYDCMEDGNWGAQPWNSWFLVTDDSVLTATEKSDWYADDAGTDYVFLGRRSKAMISAGKCADDLLLGDQCDFIAFIDKFAQADVDQP